MQDKLSHISFIKKNKWNSEIIPLLPYFLFILLIFFLIEFFNWITEYTISELYTSQ